MVDDSVVTTRSMDEPKDEQQAERPVGPQFRLLAGLQEVPYAERCVPQNATPAQIALLHKSIEGHLKEQLGAAGFSTRSLTGEELEALMARIRPSLPPVLRRLINDDIACAVFHVGLDVEGLLLRDGSPGNWRWFLVLFDSSDLVLQTTGEQLILALGEWQDRHLGDRVCFGVVRDLAISYPEERRIRWIGSEVEMRGEDRGLWPSHELRGLWLSFGSGTGVALALIVVGQSVTTGFPGTLLSWVGQAVVSVCVGTALTLVQRWRAVQRARGQRERKVVWTRVK